MILAEACARRRGVVTSMRAAKGAIGSPAVPHEADSKSFPTMRSARRSFD
jgi:hypothetical protein